MTLIPVIVIIPFIAMGSSSDVFIWLCLEISTLAFITIIALDNFTRKWEIPLFYFLIQAITSTMLMVFLVVSKSSNMGEIGSSAIFMTLAIKLGLAPYHSWLPVIMTKLSWMSCFFLVTTQKVIPFVLMSNHQTFTLTMITVLISSTVGSIMGMTQIYFKPLMAYSSITHSSWLLLLSMLNLNLWILYFTMYTMTSMLLFFMFEEYRINSMPDLCCAMMYLTFEFKFWFTILMLSMGGLPPLTGFVLKWFTIMEMSLNNGILLMWIVFMSVMNTFYYLRMCFQAFLHWSLTLKFRVHSKYPSYNFMIPILLIPLFIYSCNQML